MTSLEELERICQAHERAVRSRDIAIHVLHSDGYSLRQIGRIFNLSHERVRKIVTRVDTLPPGTMRA